jgi:hypothetical protein
MTVVCTTYLFSEQAFHLSGGFACAVAVATLVVALVWFGLWYRKYSQKNDL